MKKKVIRFVFIGCSLVLLAIMLTGCASFNREMKSITSDIAGGLDRTVTVYDYNGEEIKSWSGKFDISSNTDEIFFDDENGKRVIIHGGIVICEEN